MTLLPFKSFLKEAISNYQYTKPDNVKTLMYDFYMASYLHYAIISYNKTHAVDMNEVLEYVAKDTIKTIVETTRQDLLQTVFWAVCCEVRHIFGSTKREYMIGDIPTQAVNRMRNKIQKYEANNTPFNYGSIVIQTWLKEKHPEFLELFDAFAVSYLNNDANYIPLMGVTNQRKYKSLSDAIKIPKGEFINEEARKKAYRALKATKKDDATIMAFAEMCFNKMPWSESYGGPNWGKIATHWLELNKVSDTNMNEKISLTDRMYSLQHNNGTVFNKSKRYNISGYGWIKEALDEKFAAKDPWEFYDKISHNGFEEIASKILKLDTGRTIESRRKEKEDELSKHGIKSLKNISLETVLEFTWIKSAKFKNAEFVWNTDNGLNMKGEWLDGKFNGNDFTGVWHKGIFNGETFRGEWKDGDFHGDDFHGEWLNGTFHRGRFYGEWSKGTFKEGTFQERSVWKDGIFEDGDFEGNWLGGEWEHGQFTGKINGIQSYDNPNKYTQKKLEAEKSKTTSKERTPDLPFRKGK